VKKKRHKGTKAQSEKIIQSQKSKRKGTKGKDSPLSSKKGETLLKYVLSAMVEYGGM
jgi:hypothetical protein